MKKNFLFILLIIALIACNKKNDSLQPEQPSVPVIDSDTVYMTINLSYDSSTNEITAIPSDLATEYVLSVWMKADYIADYGDDFSDAHIKESLADYIGQFMIYGIAFPTFIAETTIPVYDFFDMPYPGEDFIAMAAKINQKTGEIEGHVFHLFFTTPK